MHRLTTPARNIVLLVTAGLLAAVGLPLSAARAADGDAVAIVNGQPITKRRMVEVLMEAYGLRVMQQLIVLELAKEETRRLKIGVSPADVEREFEQALARIAPLTGAQGQALGEDERRQSLDILLQQKGISLSEFRIGMERNAHLRKVVERNFRVDEATLREEFARSYGEKVELRHIQIKVGDVNGLHEALNLLDKKTDFAEVARRVSQNADTAPDGGLLTPFAFNDESIAASLREAAFSLKPGEILTAPIKVGRWWQIIKLERRIAPADVRFEEVRTEVERTLRERVTAERMNKLVTELFQKAEIRVLDRELKKKFNKLLQENRLTDPTTTP